MLIIISLTLASSLSSLSSSLLPTNFWLLRQAGVVSTDEDALVAAYIEALNAGDATGASRGLAALTARPIAVEFEDPSARVWSETTLPDGTLAEELLPAGPRTLLLPGASLARVDELGSRDGGLGARVWDAAIALGIWLCGETERVRGRRVLELGSGVGFGGISAALAGAAQVTLTETIAAEGATDDEAQLGGTALLETLSSNCALSGVEGITRTHALDWNDCLARDHRPAATYPVVLGADLVHDEKYSLPALCAAVAAHTAPGGVAHLMCAAGRPGVDALPDALREACAGATVLVEEMCVMSSYGVCDLVLVTCRPCETSA